MPDNNFYENQNMGGEGPSSPQNPPFNGTQNVNNNYGYNGNYNNSPYNNPYVNNSPYQNPNPNPYVNNTPYQNNAPYGNVNYGNNAPYVTYIPYGYTPKTLKERKGIKKVGYLSSISMLLVTFILIFWSFAYSIVLSILGIPQESILKSLEDPAVMQLVQIVLSSFVFTIPFIIVFKIGKFRISDLIPLGKPEKGTFLPLFLIGISFCSFANIAVNYASAIFEMFGINYNVDFGENPQGFFGFMLSLISTVFVPALVEEFACRGLILGSLRKFGEGFSILISALLFGFMHGNFQQIPFAFLVGLVLGFITVKSGTMWVAVLVHGFNNFISVFFSYFMNNVTDEVQNIIYVCYLSLSMLLGIVAVLMLKNRLNDFFKFKKADTEAEEKKKIKWFLTTPTVIVFIIVTVLESLLYFLV